MEFLYSLNRRSVRAEHSRFLQFLVFFQEPLVLVPAEQAIFHAVPDSEMTLGFLLQQGLIESSGRVAVDWSDEPLAVLEILASVVGVDEDLFNFIILQLGVSVGRHSTGYARAGVAEIIMNSF